MNKIFLKSYEPTNYKAGDYPDKIVGKLISEPTEVYCPKGNLIAAYHKVPDDIYLMAKEVALNTKPTKSARTRHGVPQLSTVYGVMPRLPIREDYCRFSKKIKEEPKNAELAYKANELLSNYYKENFPERFFQAIEEVRSTILKEYRVVDTPWVNVNVNLNQVIKYHCDKGNSPQDFSNVVIVKDGVQGGHLACPTLGLTFAQDDGYMIFFDGGKILHGVTPCAFLSEKSFRCSLVFYTLSKVKHCYPYEEELKRLAQVKTKQAKNRISSMEKLKAYLGKRKSKLAIIDK